MTTLKNIIILTFIVLFTQNCQTKICVDNIQNPVDLKAEICKNITVPFENGDTIIYNSHSNTLCGQEDQETLDTYYMPNLDSAKYINLIAKKTNRIILFNAFDNGLISLAGDTISKSILKVSKNEIALFFNGKVIKNDSVIIAEQYRRGLDFITIKKMYFYSNGWKTKVIDTVKYKYKTSH